MFIGLVCYHQSLDDTLGYSHTLGDTLEYSHTLDVAVGVPRLLFVLYVSNRDKSLKLCRKLLLLANRHLPKLWAANNLLSPSAQKFLLTAIWHG